MNRLLTLPEHPTRVAVFRALPGLGDMLTSVPALRALRAAYPRADIALIALPWVTGLLERLPSYVDEIAYFPGFPGIPGEPFSVRDTAAFLDRLQRRRFDLVFQMHGSGVVSNPIAAMFGARALSGFYANDQYCPDPERYLLWCEHEPEPLRWIRLLECGGITSQGAQLEYHLTGTDAERTDRLLHRHGLQRREYVLVHAGAVDPMRRWEPEGFARVADALAAEGFPIVLTGTTDERRSSERVMAAMSAPAVDLTGTTDLGTLGGLVSEARLVVCNDTGVSHLSAAVHTPSVVAFHREEHLARWAPLDRLTHRVVPRPTVRTMLAEAEDVLSVTSATVTGVPA